MRYFSGNLGVIRRVVLNNPVHFRNVQPSSCHVCTQQDPRICIAELEERGRTLVLFLPSLESKQNIHWNRKLEVVCGRSRCRIPKLWNYYPALFQVHNLSYFLKGWRPLLLSGPHPSTPSKAPSTQDQSPTIAQTT